ncbi:MAG: hypothetical protein ACPGRX_03845 [Bdellovibrionales bacterium]
MVIKAVLNRFSLGLSMARFGMQAFFLMVACLVSFSASAQFADSPCDPDYYDTLEARAWLEAQREITQNQNLIFKPDSVLEYTCFDNHLKELAQHAADMFSETTRWESILPSTSMDTALTNLVTSALGVYDTSNFNHDLLGGRITDWSPITAPSEASGKAYKLDSSTSGGSYACDIMQAVWMKAKCMNFIDVSAEDGFFTFEQYESDPDKRFLPTRCGGSPPWGTNLDKSYRNITAWSTDDTQTYLDKMFLPSGCGPGTGFEIQTGLTITRKAAPTSYNEHACIVPGCYWDPSENKCLQ